MRAAFCRLKAAKHFISFHDSGSLLNSKSDFLHVKRFSPRIVVQESQLVKSRRSDAASWASNEVPDWEQPFSSNSDDDELAYLEDPGKGGPNFYIQNALAALLLGLFVISAGSVFWKLLVVGFALASAAFRYSVVSILILILLTVYFL